MSIDVLKAIVGLVQEKVSTLIYNWLQRVGLSLKGYLKSDFFQISSYENPG